MEDERFNSLINDITVLLTAANDRELDDSPLFKVTRAAALADLLTAQLLQELTLYVRAWSAQKAAH